MLLLYSSKKTREIKLAKKKCNIEVGEIVYSDSDELAKPLFSKQLNLVGKPDHIVKRRGSYIPVEVRKGDTVSPFRNHILQLAAYCLLVEETYSIKVPLGVIVYGKQFKIPFDDRLRLELQNTISKTRNEQKSGVVKRNHSFINRSSIAR